MSASYTHDPYMDIDSTRPTSIDLTLELERQLDAESLPNSPNPRRPQSLDTNVLASIVTQLRLSLAEATKDRDTLTEKLADAETRDKGMRETLEHVTEKCIRMENALELAANQRKEDEETIAMLRSKVEDSRRALMRLQTEKRMSQASNLTLDLSRPPSVHASYSGPPSSKRASFVPLVGTPAARMNHRRISSLSDSGLLLNAAEPSTSWPPPKSPMLLEDPEATPVVVPPSHNRRVSLLFGRGASPQREPPPGDMEGTEMLRQQLCTVRQQLEDAKRDLVESQEAHEASELCARALRTFISENNVGVPTMANNGTTAPPPSHSKQGSTASRWGFRLWTSTDSDSNKGSTLSSTPTSTAPPASLGSAASTPSEVAPRKFGGIFGARTGMSSNGPPPYDPVHHEPMFNGSDTSSLADSLGPVSPASELPRSEVEGMDAKETLSGLGITALDHNQEIPVAAVA